MDELKELAELQQRVAELTQRIYKLEQFFYAGKSAPAREASPQVATTPKTEAPASAPPAATMPPPLVHSRGQGPSEPPIDLESRIGSQWLNRIGIVALLTGVAYFLKLAIDNEWIGPSGRVSVGMLAGIALVGWSSRLHARGYKYFSYSLTAVGIGIMYLSLWAAFQLYHLLPAPVAFIVMVLVTASAAALALKQDAQILAAVAIAGGFSTPVLLSTGENRPVVLFSYIALLDVFSIVLVALRPWRRLLLGSFVGSVVFYVGWYLNYYSIEQRHLAVAFATLFFLTFAVLPAIKNLHAFDDQNWGTSKTFIFVALINPFVYFFELFAMYESDHRTALAWAALALAAFYIAISKRLVSEAPEAADEEGIGPLHRWLHLAIAITFLTIAIPLKLESHWITMGWFVESAALLWVGTRARNQFLKTAAVVALALGVARLLFVDTFHTETLFFNSRFATYLVAIAVLGGIAWQVRKERGGDHAAFVVVTVCINVLALLALNAEVADFYGREFSQLRGTQGYYAPSDRWHDLRIEQAFTYSALWMLYGAVLMTVGFWRKSSILRWQALVLMAATIVKVFIFDLSSLSGPLRVVSFIALGILLMGMSFVYQKDWLKLSARESTGEPR
ncbi:MAG: rane protein [Candidatus Angelobacter sp.]|nr:rane protein [Candidatus Angelobacter sp.]